MKNRENKVKENKQNENNRGSWKNTEKKEATLRTKQLR
jgi:hypothetical protein